MLNRTRYIRYINKFGRALLFYVLLIIFGIPLASGLAVFVFFYSLAVLGPWLSGKISVKNQFYRVIDILFGIDLIHQFRRDIQELVGKHANIEIDDRSASKIRTDLNNAHQQTAERAERGEAIIAIVAGIFSITVGTLTGTSVIGWLLGTYSLVMTLTIGLHTVVLDVLAYTKDDDLDSYRREKLLLFEAWNKMILNSRPNQARILAMGILYRISPFGYELGKELINEALERDMSRLGHVLFTIRALSEIAEGIIRGNTRS